MLKKLLVHDFTAKMQSTFLQQKKEGLKEGEFVVIADFSENFSFVVQDEVQSFHWNNTSATVHPFVCYYRDKGELKSTCYVIISESTQYDTIAVHLFQRKLVDFLAQESGGKKPQRIFFSLMDVQHSTRTVKTSPICATISMTLGCMLSGTSSRHHMGSQQGMVLVEP